MAAAAQKIYDEWAQNSEGIDEELGSGGICDGVAEALGTIISESIDEAELFEGGHQGDDHAFVIAQRGAEAFGVDIPSGVYEYGGGYNWRKKKGVKFSPEYIVIFPVPLHEE